MKRFFQASLVILLLSICVQGNGALRFSDFHGRWDLVYRGNYGYEFRFYKSYRALCIVYLQTNLLVFKGVYTLDEKNRLRINISEMKNQNGTRPGNLAAGFTRIASSYFIFKAARLKESGRHYLELRPVSIIINGNNSDGYYEPVMKLRKQ
ncbi:MAG TPA: hypothetical protein PLI62_08440 [Spirochaetota bacterium]|nr:hypothetical protein [Spirochaetota bacterium]HQP47651.1 hypothetical protein [Spirochaetota bacterium]